MKTKLPNCSECKKSVDGNPYFVRGDVVLCYRCEGKQRKRKKKVRCTGGLGFCTKPHGHEGLHNSLTD